MTRKAESDQVIELQQKALAIQLYSLGVTQDKIAKVVGKQKLWVNQLLKGIPKNGGGNGTSKK